MVIKSLIISQSLKLGIKELSKRIYAIVSNELKKVHLSLISKENEIETNILQHVNEVKNWSSVISFKDLKSKKKIQNVYIELDLFIYPRRIRMDKEEKINFLPLKNIFNKNNNHLLILGQPGAGKTTSMKYVCQSIFFDNTFFPDRFSYPILIKLRDFNSPIRNEEKRAGIIYEELYNVFGLDIKDASQIENIKRVKETLVVEILEKINFLIIIEGFDELVYIKHKSIVLKEIESLSNKLENSKLIITSRTADFKYDFENIDEYEICPLNDEQINKFTHKWLKNKEMANDFISKIKKSPFYDTAIRPLTIAHLCAIYERIGNIPDKPKTVYKKIIYLLLEEWDEQRNIKRISKYATFEIDRKIEFLSTLAYNLTVHARKSIFSKNELHSIYKRIHLDFDLELDEIYNVVNEIESHTGLILECGFEIFEFAHKSIQEYLTAEYIVRLPVIPHDNQLIDRLPNEMAISISISSNPSQYFIEIINILLSRSNVKLDFLKIFINRIIIERPDFNNNDKVLISVLKLYTAYIDSIQKSNQLYLFIEDNLVFEFEVFIENILKRNSLDILLSNYFKKEDQVSSNGNKVIIFELTDINKKELPRIIKCRESFLYLSKLKTNANFL